MVLAGIRMETLARLIDYIYTGICTVKKIKHVMEMIELKKLLKLDINIEKRIFRKELSENHPESVSAVTNLNASREEDLDQSPPRPERTEKRPPVVSIGKSLKAFVPSVKCEPGPATVLEAGEIETKHSQPRSVPPLKLHIKTESGGGGKLSSMFERVLESIQPEQESESQQEEVGRDYEAVREQMYRSLLDPADQGAVETDKERQKEETGTGEAEQGKVVGGEDDGIPSMPTEMLVEELDNEEERLTKTMMNFVQNIDMQSSDSQSIPCTECGAQQTRESFIFHYKVHVEDVQKEKRKLVEGAAEADSGTGDAAQPDHASQSIYPSPPPETRKPVMIDEIKLDKVDEAKIDKLQEEQKRISKEITSFMALFQKGIPQLQCSECQEVVTQVTIVNHYKKHITDLNGQIESLVATKKQNCKRKPDPRREDISRKRLKEPGGGSLISKIDVNPTSNFVSNRNNPKNTDDERKKMDKRVYGRRKYQYRIQNRSEDVKVTDEEIDAEIAKESAKFSGPGGAGGGGGQDGEGEAEQVSPAQLLAAFVQFGSREYKHEFKKARDRLYKRKLRVLRLAGAADSSGALDIPRTDIEMEMLTRYNASRVKVEGQDGEASLDGEAGQDQDPAFASLTDSEFQAAVAALPGLLEGSGTTLEEGTEDMMLF